VQVHKKGVRIKTTTSIKEPAEAPTTLSLPSNLSQLSKNYTIQHNKNSSKMQQQLSEW